VDASGHVESLPARSNAGADFGFGPWKKEKEDTVAMFQTTYWLRQQRVRDAAGSACSKLRTGCGSSRCGCAIGIAAKSKPVPAFITWVHWVSHALEVCWPPVRWSCIGLCHWRMLWTM